MKTLPSMVPNLETLTAGLTATLRGCVTRLGEHARACLKRSDWLANYS